MGMMFDARLKLGSKVVVLENDTHPDLWGQEGVIEDYGAVFHFWVKIPANERGIQYAFNEDELANATQPPADTAANEGAGESTATQVDETPLAGRLENYRAIFHDVIAGHLTSTPSVMASHGLFLLKYIATLQAALTAAQSEAVAMRRERDAAIDAMQTLQNAGLSEIIETYQHRAHTASIYGDYREMLSEEDLLKTVNGLQCIEQALAAVNAADGSGE